MSVAIKRRIKFDCGSNFHDMLFDYGDVALKKNKSSLIQIYQTLETIKHRRVRDEIRKLLSPSMRGFNSEGSDGGDQQKEEKANQIRLR